MKHTAHRHKISRSNQLNSLRMQYILLCLCTHIYAHHISAHHILTFPDSRNVCQKAQKKV